MNNRQRSFASLVTNKADTKVNFRSLDTDKPINVKGEVKILNASVWKFTQDLALAWYEWGIGEWSLVYSIAAFTTDGLSVMATKL
ncbi:hypothetical protein Tco_0789697, partial [Tanacetum coccineum]